MSERITELPILVSPELIHERHRYLGSRGNRLIPYCLGIFDLQVKCNWASTESLGRARFAAAELGEVIVQKQLAAENFDRGFHDLFPFRRIVTRNFLRAKSLCVEIDRSARVVDSDVWGKSYWSGHRGTSCMGWPPVYAG